MTDSISLVGVEAFGYHGVLESEARDGQTFIVDVTMHVHFDGAATTDDLALTIDYGAVARLVVDTVQGTRFNLIEALSDEIASRIMGAYSPSAVEVTVHKPSAPIDVPFADVNVTRRIP